MKCPVCNNESNKVNNSRYTKKNTQIWRRRECLSCGSLFTTYESINLSYIVVRKKNGKVERFNSSKLFSGILLACISQKKADRGDSAIFSENISNLVQEKLLLFRNDKLTTSQIRDVILEVLFEKNIQVYLHYLAYVKKFSTKELLINELVK